MVRAVCRAYSQFVEWLPNETIRAAKDDPLFFRSKTRPVETLAQRAEIAHLEGPAVIVSSSGMLTGGPSAYYARELAGDLRNAILLTGYQDEEAPGRAIQRAIKEREEDDEVTIRIEGQPVTIRCQLGTYSLSAHADEAELVSAAEMFSADEIALVHGDPSARQSLAAALRARGRAVRLPKSGQTLDWNFAKKPWNVAKVASGHHDAPIDAAALWQALAGQEGSFYSARELAQMWYGDSERADQVAAALADDGIYFVPDWRQRNTFQVHTADQVARAQRQQAVLASHPDLVGKLIVLRNSNNRSRIGVVADVKRFTFEASVLNTKGRAYPADALVWVIGSWSGAPQGSALTGQLNALLKAAKAAQETLLPFETRQRLVAQAQPIDPAALLPASLPASLDREAALLAVVLTLADDGAEVKPGGLLPKHAFSGEPLEQNAARQVAFEAFPPEARLRKVGIEIHRKRLALTFDFPDRIQDEYGEQIERIAEQTGWEVYVNQQTNQQALGTAVIELLPPGGQIIKGPSFYLDRSEVQVETAGIEDAAAFEHAYLELTGYRLRVNQGKSGADSADFSASAQPKTGRPPMEINAAYGLIRAALEPLGLTKASLKQGQIVLAFISPEIGARHHDLIAQLAEQVGYAIGIHPHPDQNAILLKVTQAVRAAGWQTKKVPSLYTDRAEVGVSLLRAAEPDDVNRVTEEIEAETGYKLILK